MIIFYLKFNIWRIFISYLYVALSLSRQPQLVKLRIESNPQQGQLLQDERQFSRNVVFKEVFIFELNVDFLPANLVPTE